MAVERAYHLRLSANAGAADTSLSVHNMDELPFGDGFVGVLDWGSSSEELVLARRTQFCVQVLARGYDGTAACSHLSADGQRAAAYQIAKQIVDIFGPVDPRRVEKLEEQAFAPIHEWIAEGEQRALDEWARSA